MKNKISITLVLILTNVLVFGQENEKITSKDKDKIMVKGRDAFGGYVVVVYKNKQKVFQERTDVNGVITFVKFDNGVITDKGVINGIKEKRTNFTTAVKK